MSKHARILLTHTPSMRAHYFGAKALSSLRQHATVALHESEHPLAGEALIAAAAGCQILLTDRNTPVPAAALAALPDLIAVLRVAVDIRNIDVATASS